VPNSRISSIYLSNAFCPKSSADPLLLKSRFEISSSWEIICFGILYDYLLFSMIFEILASTSIAKAATSFLNSIILLLPPPGDSFKSCGDFSRAISSSSSSSS